ncbi:MAG: DUF4870 domain-containing protein [Pyrinomonadaceae bacterium]
MQNMSGGKSALGLDANVASLLCYALAPICCIGVILSIIVLITDKTNRSVRFDAIQAIGLWLVLFVINMFLGFSARIIGSFVIGTLPYLILVAAIALFIFLGFKAYQGQSIKLPVIGDLADKWSN